MKDLNERLAAHDEIIDGLVKSNTVMEKQFTEMAAMRIPDYSATLDAIRKDIKTRENEHSAQQLASLQSIEAKLGKVTATPISKQFRILFFPETNPGQYYKIVFGRLIPWGLCFVVLTYIFIIGYKAIELYRYHSDVKQTEHDRRAWLYLQQHAGKKLNLVMDEAYRKTVDK